MIRILHVSDLHFSGHPHDNQEPIALLAKVQEYAEARPGSYYLLVTGDTTNNGNDDEYANAEAALRPFRGHLLVAPGNHDFGTLGNVYLPECALAFDRWAASLGVTHAYSTKSAVLDHLCDESGTRVAAIGLVSNVMAEDLAGAIAGRVFARGEIGKAQLAQLKNHVKTLEPNTSKLVYLHHRPLECRGFGWFLALSDYKALLAVLDKESIDAVAFGHTGSHMREKAPSKARARNAVPERGQAAIEKVYSEPEKARAVMVYTRSAAKKYCRRAQDVIAEDSKAMYLLNANESVGRRQFNEIVFDGGSVNARTV